MSEKDFLEKLKSMLLIERDISLSDVLSDMEEWDSFSYVAFTAMAEDDFDKTLDPKEVKNKKTVRDLYELLK